MVAGLGFDLGESGLRVPAFFAGTTFFEAVDFFSPAFFSVVLMSTLVVGFETGVFDSFFASLVPPDAPERS